MVLTFLTGNFSDPFISTGNEFVIFLSYKITDLRTKSLSEKCLPAINFTICNMQNRNGYSDIIDIL